MAFTSNTAAEEAVDQPPRVEERRALIERIAGSVHFKRSTRLRDFLLYVGTESLKDGRPEIHEQEIGAKVFGRDSSYDRSQDNIVRVNATELRKRIELYFATEGIDEPLILDIPRGGYMPVFHWRVTQHESADVAPQNSFALTVPALPAPHPAVTSPPVRRNTVIWATICVALGVVCSVLWQQNRALRKAASPWEGKPMIAAFWGDFLRFHQQTDMVLPDDSVSIVEDIIQHPMSLGDYINRNYLRQIQASDISADRKADLDGISNHNLVTFGAVRAVQQISGLIPTSSPTRLTHARYYGAEAIKRNNVILIGGRKANPWVHLFDDQMNFITDYDYATSQQLVRNVKPKAGEQSVYVVPHDPNELIGYSVIAYLPNPGRTGNAIILAGTDSDATSAAAEFLTSDQQLDKLQKTFHTRDFPYFEVLLKTSRLSGTSFNSEMIAYRTYPELR